METKKAVGENIRVFMAKGNYKKLDLMKAAGVTGQTVTAWTNGRAMPAPDKLEKIAAFFGVPVAALFKE